MFSLGVLTPSLYPQNPSARCSSPRCSSGPSQSSCPPSVMKQVDCPSTWLGGLSSSSLHARCMLDSYDSCKELHTPTPSSWSCAHCSPDPSRVVLHSRALFPAARNSATLVLIASNTRRTGSWVINQPFAAQGVATLDPVARCSSPHVVPLP